MQVPLNRFIKNSSFLILIVTLLTIDLNSQNYVKGFKNIEKGKYAKALTIFLPEGKTNNNSEIDISQLSPEQIFGISKSSYLLFQLGGKEPPISSMFGFYELVKNLPVDYDYNSLDKKLKEHFNRQAVNQFITIIEKDLVERMITEEDDVSVLSKYLDLTENEDNHNIIKNKRDSIYFSSINNSNNILVLESFLEEYNPQGELLNSTHQLIHDIKYERVKDSYYVNDITEYLNQYPNSPHKERLISNKEFTIIIESESIEDLAQFCQTYPDHDRLDEVLEKKEYLLVSSDSNVSETSLDAFLKKHPNSPYIEKVEEKYFNLLKSSMDVNSIEYFLLEYPNSKYSNTLKETLSSIENSKKLESILKSNKAINKVSDIRDVLDISHSIPIDKNILNLYKRINKDSLKFALVGNGLELHFLITSSAVSTEKSIEKDKAEISRLLNQQKSLIRIIGEAVHRDQRNEKVGIEILDKAISLNQTNGIAAMKYYTLNIAANRNRKELLTWIVGGVGSNIKNSLSEMYPKGFSKGTDILLERYSK